MSNNPNRSEAQSRTLSDNKDEIEYLAEKFEKEFPGASREDIIGAIGMAKNSGGVYQSRELMNECVRKLLLATQPPSEHKQSR